jgi:transposase InsO family protein
LSVLSAYDRAARWLPHHHHGIHHDRADDLLRQRDLSDEHVMPACEPVRFQQEGELRAVLQVVEPQRVPRPVLRSDIERCQVFTTGLRTYNHHRGHAALGGQPPATRVPSLPGQNISPGVTDRCNVVVAESFSQSGESLAVRR